MCGDALRDNAIMCVPVGAVAGPAAVCDCAHNNGLHRQHQCAHNTPANGPCPFWCGRHDCNRAVCGKPTRACDEPRVRTDVWRGGRDTSLLQQPAPMCAAKLPGTPPDRCAVRLASRSASKAGVPIHQCPSGTENLFARAFGMRP